MKSFVSIYLAVVKEKSLRKDISAMDVDEEGKVILPKTVQVAIEEETKREAFLRKMRERDKEVAARRLAMLRVQIGKEGS